MIFCPIIENNFGAGLYHAEDSKQIKEGSQITLIVNVIHSSTKAKSPGINS
jgi:hypothetical protein